MESIDADSITDSSPVEMPYGLDLNTIAHGAVVRVPSSPSACRNLHLHEHGCYQLDLKVYPSVCCSLLSFLGRD
ncbi:hypothetical protein IG631_05066 [Alternaria alternata]|nr:hypothetical protein IG631_05066 [Alternaria alternata]